MQIKIKSPLKFILKKDLVSFTVVEKMPGIYCLTAGKFKQNIKESEYQQILANQVIAPKAYVPATEETVSAEAEETNGDDGEVKEASTRKTGKSKKAK